MTERKYKITFFANRFQTVGKLSERRFEELYTAFKYKVKRTKEKYYEYVNADRQTQATIKDIGGFVGGETEGNKRINGIPIKRSLLTLDIDTNRPNIFPYLERNIDFYCLVHSTHSHSPDANRFRIVAPLSREVTPDEYEALGRRIAYKIENTPTETLQGLFDETTFQANRLMFLPSVSADGEYICELLNFDMVEPEKNIIDVEAVLDEYLDRNNIYEWFVPTKINPEQIGKNAIANKQPLKANGLIGAFNRTYSVSQAIEKFLGHVYKKERNGRYTYTDGGSHGGGIILNEDTLFYSHHGTDPANLYYRHAFDLVRIHLFGKHDSGFTPETTIEKDTLEKTDSFKKMIDFCRELPDVVEQSDTNIALKQRIEKQDDYIKARFPDAEISPLFDETESNVVILESAENVTADEITPETSANWVVQLDGVKSVSAKLGIIFENDDKVGNLFYFDTFRDNICFRNQPYWHRNFKFGTALQDKDMAHIRVHLDKVYNIRGEKIIDDALVVEADKMQINKVKDYFEKLVWDGKERLETFFPEFFKTSVNPFTKIAFKKWLVGAVSRIYEAGSPMDLLLIIKGKQGIGKSLFFKRLATLDFNNQTEHLYSDTKIDFNKAKDSYEQLEGIWIYEWKELAGMNMSEQESIKAFVDKTEDKFRRSYGRRNVEIKRRVAFGGTTNEKTPLRDRSGNRRFLVYESPLEQHECYIKDTSLFSQEYKDQLIAEAVHLYKNGYNIFEWTDEEYIWWEKSNEDNLAENDLLGGIENYLNMKRPDYWYSMSEDDMKMYHDSYNFEHHFQPLSPWAEENQMKPLIMPEKVCIHELWKIALKQREITINRYHRELILQAVDKLGWKLDRKQTRFGHFGSQQTIIRKTAKTEMEQLVENIQEESAKQSKNPFDNI